jgi:hypothetical protein
MERDMVRSTSVAWKTGLAFMALAFSWQPPALADDGSPETVAVPQQPVEPTEVRVILLPPADETVFAMRPPGAADVPAFTLMKPTTDGSEASPKTEPAPIREEAIVVDPPSLPEPPAPADVAAVAEVTAVNDALRAQPEPVKPRPRIAKAEPAPIPPLPERVPFRPEISKIKPFEIEEVAVASPREEKPKPALFANVNKAFRSLSDTITGRKREEEAASPGEGTAAASAGLAGDERTEERQSSSLLDKLRFWDQ